jgi:nicotinamide phosphoribosyltransferase
VFGLQKFLNDFLAKPITIEEVQEASKFAEQHGVPFNDEGFTYIVNELEGKWPLFICAIPEGTVVPVGTPIAAVMNTDPKCFWLTSYIETAMLRAIWYPSTVATLSKSCKDIIGKYLEETGTPELLPFKLHDFGARGASSSETASIGGMAHLVNFDGTDTMEGILCAMKHYDANMCGFSIPASEHSTITSWGRDLEKDSYQNMIEQFGKPESIYACVSDSYNIWQAIRMWKELEPLILEKGGTLVIRPDSGDPVNTPVTVVEECLEKFGYTKNDKGYKLLPSHIRVIQGDRIGPREVRDILSLLKYKNISADNIGFGMGGGLLQKVDRDTLGFAMKCSAIVDSDGNVTGVSKSPIGDSTKNSLSGFIEVCIDDMGKYQTLLHKDVTKLKDSDNVMQAVYCDGLVQKRYTLDEVRANSMN